MTLLLLLAALVPVPGSPLLPGLSDLSRMLEPAASLLQTGITTGTGVVTGVDAVTAGQPGVTAVTTVPVVTTVPAPVPPPMMMPTILPVIFAVAVIKALILGNFDLFMFVYELMLYFGEFR